MRIEINDEFTAPDWFLALRDEWMQKFKNICDDIEDVPMFDSFCKTRYDITFEYAPDSATFGVIECDDKTLFELMMQK